MRNIEVAVLDSHGDPGGMMMFLAKLTQRGHSISDMASLMELYAKSSHPRESTVRAVANLPHGTIKRFCPITIAIVGASRRFLAQARTNQVGFNYVSASLQYSDYSGKARFVVPYALTEYSETHKDNARASYVADTYLKTCQVAMKEYEDIALLCDNDTAGYVAPQGLRNILIMQGNHEAWRYFIRLRSCNRNTVETQYVTMLIWEALLNTEDGQEFFGSAGPDCVTGICREGAMSCGKSMQQLAVEARTVSTELPRYIIEQKWPLLCEENR